MIGMEGLENSEGERELKSSGGDWKIIGGVGKW